MKILATKKGRGPSSCSCLQFRLIALDAGTHVNDENSWSSDCQHPCWQGNETVWDRGRLCWIAWMLFHVALRRTQSRPSTDICHNCLLVKRPSFIGVYISVYFLFLVRTVMIEFISPTRVLGRFLCALPVARRNVASPSENFAFQVSWLKAARGAAYPGRGTH